VNYLPSGDFLNRKDAKDIVETKEVAFAFFSAFFASLVRQEKPG